MPWANPQTHRLIKLKTPSVLERISARPLVLLTKVQLACAELSLSDRMLLVLLQTAARMLEEAGVWAQLDSKIDVFIYAPLFLVVSAVVFEPRAKLTSYRLSVESKGDRDR